MVLIFRIQCHLLKLFYVTAGVNVVGKYDEQFLKLFCHTMQQLKQVENYYLESTCNLEILMFPPADAANWSEHESCVCQRS